jgi:hypothetical protein
LTVKLQDWESPAASVAVYPTLLDPRGNKEELESPEVCENNAPGQLSVAITAPNTAEASQTLGRVTRSRLPGHAKNIRKHKSAITNKGFMKGRGGKENVEEKQEEEEKENNSCK